MMAKIAKTADRMKVMDTTKSTDCPKCGKATRIGSTVVGEGKDVTKRVRTCKRCKAEI